MKRERKYRVFIDGEMVLLSFAGLGYFDFEGSYALSFAVDGYSEFWAHENYEGITEKIKDSPIMDFTGHQDKNGVDIFDGDILKGFKKEQGKDFGHEVKDAVRLNRGGFEVFSKPMQNFSTDENYRIKNLMWHESGPLANRSGWYYELNDVEIIGNIHQNPDMLK